MFLTHAFKSVIFSMSNVSRYFVASMMSNVNAGPFWQAVRFIGCVQGEKTILLFHSPSGVSSRILFFGSWGSSGI